MIFNFIERVIEIAKRRTLTHDDADFLWMTGCGVLFAFFVLFLCVNLFIGFSGT